MFYFLIPSRGQAPLTPKCLQRLTIPHKVLTTTGSPVADARNVLVRKVLEATEDDDTVLWLDDDVYFEQATVQVLMESLTDSNQVIMANVPLRRPNAPPAAFLNDSHKPIPPEATGLVPVQSAGVLAHGYESRLTPETAR